MDSLEERKPRITVLFSKLRPLTPRTIEYKTDYTYANIRLLICHGPATITSCVGNVSAAFMLAKRLKSLWPGLGNFQFLKEQVVRTDIISILLSRIVLCRNH